MSEPDVREIKLQLRYPESRQEDITDAYMRGYKSVMRVTGKLIARLNKENAKLRELLQDYHRYEHEDCHSCRYINECRADESGRCIAPMRLGERYRELVVE